MSTATTLLLLQAAQRRSVLATLQERGAVSAASAVSVDSLPATAASQVESLRSEGAVVATAEGLLYLDTAHLAAERVRHEKIAVRVLAVLVPVIVAFLVWVGYLLLR